MTRGQVFGKTVERCECHDVWCNRLAKSTVVLLWCSAVPVAAAERTVALAQVLLKCVCELVHSTQVAHL